MPRLSHTFDLTPVDREVVDRTVAALHEVARNCRFDGRGWLLTPDEESVERLLRRADELGLVDGEEAEQLRQDRKRAAERLREGDVAPGQEDELAVQAAKISLQLQRGRHLEPRSRYLVAELSPEGVPVDPADDADKGWSGTGVTVTAWDERGVSSVDYVMPDTAGSAEPPVTWGAVVHNGAEGTLTWTVRVRLPGRGAWLRSASAEAHADLDTWYAALSGGGGADRPVRLSADHALARVEGWLVPVRTAEGRWSVEAVLDVRGRGVFRPFVAAAMWAVRSSFRREEARNARLGTGEPTVREQLDRAAGAWERIARSAPQVPELLHELAAAMAGAAPGV
ncbi:hypothetical protein [Nocardiopsis algeriensis]|uniref:Uncharacterized protein n=1 Tax=Nocardiopsis algeriensis TaxID=1478215 RepID=A0A841IR64_9ACTN|nr:hypothetical protein [Nocardiopsis algeriensis]